MDKLDLLRDLFDQKVINVLALFLSNPQKQFYLKEISDSVSVPMASTHRILKRLSRLEIIDEKNISKFRVYQLGNNEKVMYLDSFIKVTPNVIEKFIDELDSIKGIRKVIQHGKESDKKVNLLIIGDDMDLSKIKSFVAQVKSEYDYNISYMSLTEEQFEQMSKMGLYSGQKKLLYERED